MGTDPVSIGFYLRGQSRGFGFRFGIGSGRIGPDKYTDNPLDGGYGHGGVKYKQAPALSKTPSLSYLCDSPAAL